MHLSFMSPALDTHAFLQQYSLSPSLSLSQPLTPHAPLWKPHLTTRRRRRRRRRRTESVLVRPRQLREQRRSSRVSSTLPSSSSSSSSSTAASSSSSSSSSTALTMEQARHWMWMRRKYCSSYGGSSARFLLGTGSGHESWEEKAFAEDAAGQLAWPPRSYSCGFCRREFRSAQALGGHMNVHRRDRARLRQLSCSSSSSLNPDGETCTAAAAAAGEVDLCRQLPEEAAADQAPPQGNPNYSSAVASPPSRVSVTFKSSFLSATTGKEPAGFRSTARFDDVEESSTFCRQIAVPNFGPGGSNGRCFWIRRDPAGVDGEEGISSCSNKRRRTSEQQQVVRVEELDLELRLG